MTAAQQTTTLMRQLRLTTMAQTYELQLEQPKTSRMGFDDRLGLLIEAEASARESRKLNRMVQIASLPENASLEDLDTHRACLFFTIAGTLLLREHYGLPATITTGGAALMVNERDAQVVVYGRERDGLFVGEADAFHAWVQCDGWMIDFMAPILGVALREDGHTWNVPRRMLQKRLDEGKLALGDIQHAGEFCLSPDSQLAETLIDGLSVGSSDLLKVCQAWFRRPPKPVKDLAMADSQGPTRKLVLRAPCVEGVW